MGRRMAPLAEGVQEEHFAALMPGSTELIRLYAVNSAIFFNIGRNSHSTNCSPNKPTDKITYYSIGKEGILSKEYCRNKVRNMRRRARMNGL